MLRVGVIFGPDFDKGREEPDGEEEKSRRDREPQHLIFIDGPCCHRPQDTTILIANTETNIRGRNEDVIYLIFVEKIGLIP